MFTKTTTRKISHMHFISSQSSIIVRMAFRQVHTSYNFILNRSKAARVRNCSPHPELLLILTTLSWGVKYKTLLNNWQSRKKKVPSRLNNPYLIWNKMGEWSMSPSVSNTCCKLKLNESLLSLVRVKKIKGRKLVVLQVQKNAHFNVSVENTNMEIQKLCQGGACTDKTNLQSESHLFYILVWIYSIRGL